MAARAEFFDTVQKLRALRAMWVCDLMAWSLALRQVVNTAAADATKGSLCRARQAASKPQRG